MVQRLHMLQCAYQALTGLQGAVDPDLGQGTTVSGVPPVVRPPDGEVLTGGIAGPELGPSGSKLLGARLRLGPRPQTCECNVHLPGC